jgi:hypothetical protein
LVTGTAEDPGVEAIVADLTRDIACLPPGRALTIAEFSAARLTVWKIRSDGAGTPRVRYWWYDWSSLRTQGQPVQGQPVQGQPVQGQLSQRELLDRIRPEDDSRVVLTRTEPAVAAVRDPGDAGRAFEMARNMYPRARVFRSAPPVDDLLKEATARMPLPPSVWYELVLLRRTRSGRLELTAQQMFLPEARRGDSRTFTVRCEASDENGTVFAVVARDAAFSFELVSMASARIPPGTYHVTATLLRPGRVRFDGLPVKLSEDGRSWLDVVAAVPDRLDVIGPSHLIVALEVCGSADGLQARVDRAGQLIAQVRADADGPVAFSLLTYASHSHDRRTGDEPVTALAWAQTEAAPLDRRLDRLRARDPALSRYPRAAQIECMLAEVMRRLRGPEAVAAGRPVLVTIGDKPAFPAHVDPATGIIPCPQRNDWRPIFLRLAEEHAGMAFGVIRDDEAVDDMPDDPVDDIWRNLGTDASATLVTFDARRFAVGLGLLSATMQYLPLPLAAPEGAD